MRPHYFSGLSGGLNQTARLQLRKIIDQLVASVEWPVLTVEMPDELLINDDGVIERDRVADVSVLAAVDVWMNLRNWRLIPDGIRGRLASMFDAQGLVTLRRSAHARPRSSRAFFQLSVTSGAQVPPQSRCAG
jgi:hypothetical protein